MKKTFRQFMRLSADCAGVPRRLPVLPPVSYVTGRIGKSFRQRMGRIGESIN